MRWCEFACNFLYLRFWPKSADHTPPRLQRLPWSSDQSQQSPSVSFSHTPTAAVKDDAVAAGRQWRAAICSVWLSPKPSVSPTSTAADVWSRTRVWCELPLVDVLPNAPNPVHCLPPVAWRPLAKLTFERYSLCTVTWSNVYLMNNWPPRTERTRVGATLSDWRGMAVTHTGFNSSWASGYAVCLVSGQWGERWTFSNIAVDSTSALRMYTAAVAGTDRLVGRLAGHVSVGLSAGMSRDPGIKRKAYLLQLNL